ncbi:MAG: hypoxanthine phosphoribosyltransferase [Clostridia bacterium]|nr:hypoxanthine phosphoribosyltransferase [Clostridia bacterium]
MDKNVGIEKILITQEQIAARIKEIASQLDKDYAGKKPVCICILKGSFLFFADLVREMKIPLFVDFISVTTDGGLVPGKIKFLKDLQSNIKGKHVLLIEDILDSGSTLYALKKQLEEREPASVKIVTLLDKKARRDAPVTSDYTLFNVDDVFTVGYGLDYAGEYRNLPYIGCLGFTL